MIRCDGLSTEIDCYEWEASGNPNQSWLSFADSLREVEDVAVIWWRKPDDYLVSPEVQDDWAVKYCQEETKSLIHSLSGLSPKAKWVNNYYNMRLPAKWTMVLDRNFNENADGACYGQTD